MDLCRSLLTVTSNSSTNYSLSLSLFPSLALYLSIYLSIYRSYDRAIALRRMESAGAVITTTESILFELVQTASSPKFKPLSQKLKIRNAQGPDEFAAKTEM